MQVGKEGGVRAALARQWPMLLALAAAISLCGGTAYLRLTDSANVQAPTHRLDDYAIGVFLDSGSILSLTLKPEAAFADIGGQAPETRWTLDLDPGSTNRATLSLALLDAPELWNLEFHDPVDIVVVLPEGATLSSRDKELLGGADGGRACASWSSENGAEYAAPRLQRALSGGTVVTCLIPALGELSQFFFEISFDWEEDLGRSAGFGRQAAWVRIPEFYAPPLGVDLPEADTRAISRPVDVQLQLDPDERLLEAFPAPDGGGLSERSWAFDRGGDIEYTLERSAERTFLAPATDLLLLFAGLAFGLMPSLRRRRAHGSAEGPESRTAPLGWPADARHHGPKSTSAPTGR